MIIDAILIVLLYAIKSSEVLSTAFKTHSMMDADLAGNGRPVNEVADNTIRILNNLGNEFITIKPEPFLTKHFLLDVFIFIMFTLVIYMTFYVLFSHNIIEYFREINVGVERIRNGDLTTSILVKGYDEISDLAYSINSMRVELKQSIDKERELEKTKNNMITNVAHDLRTPLTSMIGYLELIKMNADLPVEIKDKYVGIAYDKSKRLERLINNLFDYTRYEKTKIQLNLCKLDIYRFVEQLAEEFYPSMEEKHLDMVTHFPSKSMYVNGDGELLARALGNLVSNAIKYGADGKQIILELTKKEHKIYFRVINFGKIIPDKDLYKIFEQFYRVDSSRSSTGTGLGLAIAKNVIEMHGGNIKVSSDEKGTVFEVELEEYNENM